MKSSCCLYRYRSYVTHSVTLNYNHTLTIKYRYSSSWLYLSLHLQTICMHFTFNLQITLFSFNIKLNIYYFHLASMIKRKIQRQKQIILYFTSLYRYFSCNSRTVGILYWNTMNSLLYEYLK